MRLVERTGKAIKVQVGSPYATVKLGQEIVHRNVEQVRSSKT